MRELTDREKQLVTKLVNDKQAGNISTTLIVTRYVTYQNFI